MKSSFFSVMLYLLFLAQILLIKLKSNISIDYRKLSALTF